MRFFKYLKSNKGFTIIEAVLSMSLAAIVMALTSQIMLTQLETYNTVSQQQSTVSDIRYTLNRMSGEMLRLETEDIIDVSDNRIDFVDADGNTTYYSLSSSSIMRGNDTILENVDDMTLTYIDSNGNETNVAANVRQIEISITSSDSGTGSYTLSTRIIPRNFMYANYD